MGTWNDNADRHDAQHGEKGDWFGNTLIKPYLKRCLGVFGKKKGISVLDVGCGNGDTSRFFAAQGADVTAIDAANRMIRNAKKYTTKRIKYVCGDFLKSRFARKFDLLACINVLQDTPDMDKIVRKLYKCCHPDSQVVVVIKHPCFAPKDDNLGWTLVDDKGIESQAGQGLSNVLMSGKNYKGKHFINDGYFSRKVTQRSWGEVSTKLYHFTLSTYIKAFMDNGFTLVDMQEPKPADKTPDHLMKDLASRVPVFLMMRFAPAAKLKPRVRQKQNESKHAVVK